MDDTAITRFSAVPWAAALINDPKWTPRTTSSRLPKASGEDSFIAETLRTDRTVRSLLTLRPTREENGDFAYKEIATLIELGDGLNGYPSIVHGGFAATMLDEVCGVLIVANIEKKIERLRDLGRLSSSARTNYLTAYLNTTYKRPVPTPGVLLCRATLAREDGRKLYVRGTIEDGNGTVYTEAEALFIEVTTKL